jgi:hypothetical protein
MSMPVPLNAEAIKGLTLSELVTRMDSIRLIAERQRYPNKATATIPTVRQLLDTAQVEAMDEARQRRSVDVAFRFLLQLDLCSMSSGNANAVLYNSGYNISLWQSPVFRLAHAAFGQYEIVASRIALECFFDLLHVLETGERLPVKSKFKAFKKWILRDDNSFVYFLGHIADGHEFDRNVRTPEVHGTSRYAQELLMLTTPDDAALNHKSRLVNVLSSVWQPLLQLLNGVQPTSISVFDNCHDFAEAYFRRKDAPDNFDTMVCELAKRLS